MKIDLNSFYHPKSQFCGSGNMFLVSNVTLPCDQIEV